MKIDKKPRLNVDICGINFKNPIIAASGTVGFCGDYRQLIDFSKIGGVSLKGLTLEKRKGNDGIRIAETHCGIINSVGLQNPGLQDFEKNYLPKLKGLDTVLIANIAGNVEEDYLNIAKRLDNCQDIDMLEINISCPNVKSGGIAFGIYPNTIKQIVGRIKKNYSKPIMVKLSPNVSSITDNALAAQDGGADCLSLINTVHGLAVDIKTRQIVCKGGLSGKAIKPIGLRMVYEVCKVTNLPVVGIGGISNYVDVVEYIMCGAKAVQVGTANFLEPNTMIDIVNDLQSYMVDNNIEDIEQIRGILL